MAVCFSRRRCTEEAMRIASRYFATVRRAISIPASRSFSTMVSSDRTCAGFSASISCLMRWRTASAECASPPSAAAIAEVKKYFNSKIPRLVAMYLLAVTRETVDSAAGRDPAQPGFGAQLVQITQEGRQLVYRYVRNREPLFHDDL